jgi:hypothetical protein
MTFLDHLDNDLAFKKSMLEYYRLAMESRRSLSLRILTGVVALYLFGIWGAGELTKYICELNKLRYVMRGAAVTICILYACFIFQIEKRNKFDREKYLALERYIWDRITGALTPALKIETECFCTALSKSWAGTWAVIAVALLSVVTWIIAGLLQK